LDVSKFAEPEPEIEIDTKGDAAMAIVESSNTKPCNVTRLVVSMILVLMAGISSIANAQNSASAENPPQLVSPIVGSWIFNIDLGQGITFNSLISFTAGGVVITSASVPTPSPFYGSWRRTGPNSYDATFYAFVPDSTTGQIATLKDIVRLHLTSPNELTATGVGYNCDVQGENCTQANSSQATGKRILPE
jgi:hypothetical protein